MHASVRLAPFILAAVVSACGGSEADPEILARSIENLQCEPPVVTIAQLDAELANAGVSVRAASCAWDGLLRVAACGTPSPYLRVIEVQSADAAAAKSLGYRPTSEFTQLIPIDCPTP